MSDLGGSGVSAISGSTGQIPLQVSPILSGYQADDERSFSIAASMDGSIVSNLVASESNPSPYVLRVQNASPKESPLSVPVTPVEGITIIEESGDYDGFSLAQPMATLLSGDKLSNTNDNKSEDIVEDEGYIRSRMFSSVFYDEPLNKRRRLAFD